MDKTEKSFTARVIIHKEEDMFVAECIELGTVSQGKTIDEALNNIVEATELYIEDMSIEELTKACKEPFGIMPIQLTPPTAYNVAS